MLKSRAFRRLDLLLLVLVLVVAGAVRLGRIGVVSFQYDEATISLNVLDMLRTHDLPLTSFPSSVGIPVSPISLYVLAIPYSFSSSPLIATLFIAVLNTLGVGLLFLIAQRYASRSIALIAGMAYAANPWAIWYSRKIWEPDLFSPFLVAAALLGLYGYLECPTDHNKRRKMWAQGVFWPILFIGLGMHFYCWTALPLYLLIVLLGRKHIHYRAAVTGLVLGIALLIPYAIGLVQSYQDNPLPFTEFGDEHSGPLELQTTALHQIMDFAAGKTFARSIGFPTDVENNLWTLNDLWTLIGLAALLGLLGLTVRAWRIVTMVAVLWVVPPLVVLTPNWTLVMRHYFVGTLPGLALLTGLGVGALAEWIARLASPVLRRVRRTDTHPVRMRQVRAALQVTGTSLMAMILLTQALWWFQIVDKADQVVTTGEMNRPLYRLIDVADQLAAHENVVIVSNNYWQLYNKEPQVWRVLLRDSVSCLRAIGPDNFAVFPNGPFAVLTTPNAGEQAVHDLYLTDQRQQIALREGEVVYTIDTFETPLTWPGPKVTKITPVTFDNGVQLTGYSLEQNRMILEWSILKAGGLNYQYTGQFLNANGERTGQRDATFVPGTYRCSGDQVITWIDINLPSDITTLRVAMYHLWLDRAEGPIYSANVIDQNGQPVGQYVDIPLNLE